jgi:hypothetical protein
MTYDLVQLLIPNQDDAIAVDQGCCIFLIFSELSDHS